MRFFPRSSKKPDDSLDERFWEWFAANSDRFLTLNDEQPDDLFDELHEQLARVHPQLTLEFSSMQEFGREFIISADGIREAFPSVIRLVDQAPNLSHWKITAFRPRHDVEMKVEVSGATVGPEDFWFRIEPDDNLVGLYLYISNYEQKEIEKPLTIASFLFLDNALGEFDVETKIGFIERQPLPSNPSQAGLKPIHELAVSVDRLFGELNPSI